jgi:uncharacterized protein YraI
MQRMHGMIGLASLLGAALIAGPALAVTASSPTGHLNVRSGPGFQYQVVSQIPANVPAQITGCVSDYSWCAVALPGGLTGWASAPYLVTSAAGTPKNLQVVGAQLGIPVVTPANTGAAVVATPPVGAMVPVPPSVGVVAPVPPPPPDVVSYVTMQAIQPVIVNGEVMIGATLPPAVPVYSVPASPYVFSYVNGQRVLVEPTARKIVYVFR